MNAMAELSPYLVLILVGFLPNEIWRALGLLLARGLDEDSEIVVWSRAVATAILLKWRAGHNSIERTSGRGSVRVPRLCRHQAIGFCRSFGRGGGAAVRRTLVHQLVRWWG